VAIDAIDYSKKISIDVQFKPDAIIREIMKAIAGIKGAEVLADG